ncbi:MAG: SEL1-like repeat protein, partial [Pseudomonadota bacterium]
AFIRLADPDDVFPLAFRPVQAALGAAGFAMTVVTVDGGAEGACAEGGQGALPYAVLSGVPDREPFGDGDGRSTAEEIEAYLAAALERAARRDGDCAGRYSLILRGADDSSATLVQHGPEPLFEEMESRLMLERFEGLFLLESDDQTRVQAFLDACEYCPNEAVLAGRLRAMRQTERVLALETEIWRDIENDAAPDRLQIYVRECTLCAFKDEAEVRLAALDAQARAEADEARRFAEAAEARDLPGLRAYLADCAACADRDGAQALIAELEADAAYQAERAALAAALTAADDAALDAWLEACRVCDGRAEAEAALDRLARLAALRGPCLAQAGLPQHGGPRRLDAIDAGAARAACGAVLTAFPDDPQAVVALGRVAQADGQAEEARRAYQSGVSAGLPAAHGLLAYLHFAPPGGAAADPQTAEALALDGAAAGDWLSKEILTILYSRGLVADRSAADAYKIAAPAAEEGNPVAQFFIGYFHQTGEGAVEDPAAAADWLGRAVAQGYLHANSFLAELHEKGLGDAADPERAAELYWTALEAGDRTARDRMTAQLSEREREVIRIIQQRLRDAGVYNGRVDGLPGPGTVRAVEAFVDDRAAQAG